MSCHTAIIWFYFLRWPNGYKWPFEVTPQHCSSSSSGSYLKEGLTWLSILLFFFMQFILAKYRTYQIFGDTVFDRYHWLTIIWEFESMWKLFYLLHSWLPKSWALLSWQHLHFSMLADEKTLIPKVLLNLFPNLSHLKLSKVP